MSATRTYRVAMVAACPFPSLRGSQVLIRELAEELAAAGHSVHVVTYPTAQHMVPLQRIAIHRAPKLPGLWTARPFGWQKIILDLLLVWLLYRVVRRESIDVIHAHNLEGPLVGYLTRLLTGVPVVYHAHNALSDELPCYFRAPLARRVARRIGRMIDHRIARWADFTIALTDRLGAFLSMRGAAGRVAVVAPGVAPLRIGSRLSERAGRRSEGPVIVYAGNLDPYQDLDLLLAGFERVSAVEPSARLVLVTHKGEHAATRRRSADLANRPGVMVFESTTFAAAQREIGAGDVVVCPRGSWSGFPIKVLNYMSLGRPIVHARASAHAIEDGAHGLVFADGDPRSLARAILRLLHDPALAARLGQEARRAAREIYAWPKLLQQVSAVYEGVVTGGAAAGAVARPSARVAERHTMETGKKKDSMFGSAKDSLMRGVLPLCWLALAATLPACSAEHPPAAPLPPLAVAPAGVIDPTSDLYRLQPGDVLRVKFLYHPELDVKVPVEPDGTVQVASVGELAAAGKTADELARAIETKSSDHLRDPVVTVIVAELGARKVYVGGEVRTPGPVLYREGLTALQAILERGGFTEVARTDSVLHLTLKDSQYEATRLDLSGNADLGTAEAQALGVYDVIWVPRTFIGDANAFVRLYIRGLIPTIPRASIGVSP